MKVMSPTMSKLFWESTAILPLQFARIALRKTKWIQSKWEIISFYISLAFVVFGLVIIIFDWLEITYRFEVCKI
jgi:hypothetical protein